MRLPASGAARLERVVSELAPPPPSSGGVPDERKMLLKLSLLWRIPAFGADQIVRRLITKTETILSSSR